MASDPPPPEEMSDWECQRCGEVIETPNENHADHAKHLPPLWCDCGAEQWRRIDEDDDE